jgi:hypothetical protein
MRSLRFEILMIAFGNLVIESIPYRRYQAIQVDYKEHLSLPAEDGEGPAAAAHSLRSRRRHAGATAAGRGSQLDPPCNIVTYMIPNDPD